MEHRSIPDFFADVVVKVIGPYLGPQRFSEIPSSHGEVGYQRADATVVFSYWLEDLPAPPVSVVVGRRAPDGSVRDVALWRAIPESAPERGYTVWRFREPADLERVLVYLTHQVLPRYGRPLWEDDALFASLLAEQQVEAEQEHQQAVDRALLVAARRAFEDGNYRVAVDNYVLFDRERLSAADRRRLYQARARLRSGSRFH